MQSPKNLENVLEALRSNSYAVVYEVDGRAAQRPPRSPVFGSDRDGSDFNSLVALATVLPRIAEQVRKDLAQAQEIDHRGW